MESEGTMINVHFFRQEDGSVHLEMAGHAGAAPKGEDLVCAGASTLCYTLGQAVTFLWNQEALLHPPVVEIQQGRASIIATPKDGYESMVYMAWWTVQAGFYTLSSNYPQYVRLRTMTV